MLPPRTEVAGTKVRRGASYSKGGHPWRRKSSRIMKAKNTPPTPPMLGGAAYAPHDQEAEKLAKKTGKERKPDENAGDARTPEKMIGEIKYARKPDKKEG